MGIQIFKNQLEGGFSVNKKNIFSLFIIIFVISISLVVYYIFKIQKIKIKNNFHSTGESERLQDVSSIEKKEIPENEDNINKIKGEVIEYEPGKSITVDYFENTIQVNIVPDYTFYYEIYSDPTKDVDFDSAYTQDLSKYIEIGKIVIVELNEQLREDSNFVAKKIFIFDIEK